MYRFISLFLFFTLPCVSCAKAQLLQEDTAVRYWQQFTHASPREGLFVHLDKNVYTNNEQIWFSAYFLGRQAPGFDKQEFISVSLISPQTRRVYLETKFAAGEGFSFGNIAIPDTIPPGNYLFTAFGNCTDANHNPLAVYRQLITIKSIIRNGFRASIRTIDSLGRQEKVYMQAKAEDLNGQPVKKAAVIYSADGKKTEKGVTDNNGLLTIALPKAAKPGIVQVRVNYDNEFQLLSAVIPPLQLDTGLVVNFYPESGSLITGVPARMLMEVTTASGKPVAAKAVLYRDNEAEDTIVVNSSGLCSFLYIPFEEDVLHVRFLQGTYTSDTARYFLPLPAAGGVLISSDNSVFADTLSFQLSAALPKEALLFVYTQEQLLFSSRISLDRQRKKIKLPLAEAGIANGICTVRVTDSSGSLLSERLFFRSAGKHPPVSIETDKQTYTRHEKVTLRIRCDSASLAGAFVVSATAVQETRLLKSGGTDIEEYSILQAAFGSRPPVSGRAVDNRRYLEQLLLRGPGRKEKQAAASVNDSCINSLQVQGTVRIDGKKPKKPHQLLVFVDSAIAVTETDNDGVFTLAPQLITTVQGKRIVLRVSKSEDKKIAAQLSNAFAETAERLAADHSFEHPDPAANTVAEKRPTDEFPVAKRLKTVVVKARRTDYGTGPGGMGANECGDYVCQYNILNCPNHYNDFLNRPPRPGEMLYETTNFRMAALYKGCAVLNRDNPNTVKIPGIYLTKEFFGVEQAQKDAAEPEYRSTLFWKPGIVLQPGVDAEFSFLTSDITGNFKVIVQGIAADGTVVYREVRFRVGY